MTRPKPFDVRAAPALHRVTNRPLVRAMLELVHDPRIDTKPQTVFGLLERKVERQLDSEKERAERGAAVRELLALCATLTPKDCAAAARRAEARHDSDRGRIARSPAGAALLEFLDDAEKRYPGAMLLGVPNPAEHGLATLPASACLRELIGLRGERRAEGLLSATSHVYEAVYQPYLKALWRVANPTQRKAPPEGGRLLRELDPPAARFPGLVVSDANRMRNAAAHRHSKYLADSHALVLHDRHDWREIVGYRGRRQPPALSTARIGSFSLR